MSSKRQRYTLGHGVYSGRIILDSGETIWVEYANNIVHNAVSSLFYLQDAIEYIAARICEEESYNSIQIRSIFHSTTIQNGKKVPDRLGQHLTFTAARYVNDVVTESKTGHAYVDGVNLMYPAERWYDRIELGRVRWDDERGSSQGSRDTRSTSSRQSGRGSMSRDTTGQSIYADGWYPDPWMLETGMSERYYANGEWTEYAR